MIAPAAVALTTAALAGLGGADGAQRPAANGSDNGVKISVDRRRGATIEFASATRRIVVRGGQVSVECAARSPLYPSPRFDRVIVTWPRGQKRTTVRRLRRGYGFCSLGARYDDHSIFATLADVPLSAAGRAWLDEELTAHRAMANLQKVITGETENGGTVPPLEGTGYTPLATADALPAREQIGVFVDRPTRRIRVVVLTKAGKPIYVERVGDEFRTNAPAWLIG
jgi:hypothetical protein